jgi:hypothetical protein
MRWGNKALVSTLAAGLALQFGIGGMAWAEAAGTQESGSQQATTPTEQVAPNPVAEQTAGNQAAGATLVPAVVEKKTYTVPSGTKVLLQLRSAVNTKSAKPGDGVYLSSTFPVVLGKRVMIPAGVYVQGVVDRVERAGHVKGRAQLDMHFTSIIFPNGTVVEVPGVVNSLPGASKQTVKDDGEGTIEQSGDKGRNATRTAAIAIPVGGTVGSIGGLPGGHPLAGGIAGIGAGVAAVGLVTLFTRGADVNIESGTQVEMVLQRPLILEEENLDGEATVGTAPALVPSSTQPRPIQKLGRPRVLCPPGGLGCQ